MLGFIALVTFFMIKSNFFNWLSGIVYPDDPTHTHLLHLFEDVHFGLFFTMMMYLVLVIWVLYVQASSRSKWRSLEDETKAFMRLHGMKPANSKENTAGLRKVPTRIRPPSLPMPKDEYLEWRYNGGGRIPVGFDGVLQKDDGAVAGNGDLEMADGVVSDRPERDELHNYMLVRAHFINGCKKGPPEGKKNTLVDMEFDFGRYLDNSLGQLLIEVVLVHEVTWLVIAVVMFIAYVAFAFVESSGTLIIVTIFGVLLVASMLWLYMNTSRILVALSPPSDANLKQVFTGHRTAIPPFDKNPLVKGGGSKHEQLFFLGEKGPNFLMHFLRTTLLLTAIYVVAICVVFIPHMHDKGIFYVLPINAVCVLVVGALVMPILPKLTLITSIGHMKRSDVIDNTLRQVKLERSIKTIKILAALQSQLKRFKKIQGTDGGMKRTNFDNIDPKQKEDLREAFNLFDEDGSGTIDSKELFNLLRDLGQQVDPAEADRLILEMDTGVRARASGSARRRASRTTPHALTACAWRPRPRSVCARRTMARSASRNSASSWRTTTAPRPTRRSWLRRCSRCSTRTARTRSR